VPATLARRTCLILAAITPFMGLPGGWLLQHAVIAADPLVIAGLATGLAVVAVAPLGTWQRQDRRSCATAQLHLDRR
jgi:hypothetical protein